MAKWEKIHKRKKLRQTVQAKLTAYIFIILVTCPLLTSFGINAFYKIGIINDFKEINVLIKLVVGLNHETEGTNRNNPDVHYIAQFPSEQQGVECLRLINERLSEPKAVIKLIAKKTNTAWFGKDSYYNWYTDAQRAEYVRLKEEGLSTDEINRDQELLINIKSGIEHLDTFFVHFIYLFSIFGLFMHKKWSASDSSNIMLFIALGWIAVIMLTEVQSRYRYPAMPAFSILAGIGIYVLCQRFMAVMASTKKKKRSILKY